MINRQDFDGKSYQEMMAAMEADLVLYREKVANFTNLDECNAEEQVLMAEMDTVQEKLDNVAYELPTGVEYDGKKYSKKDIVTKIIYFLNKLEVKWEQTLGLYQLVRLWKGDDFTHIPYHVYDSTLRCLNQVAFKGYSEWTDILAVNEYLGRCHNEYSLDTGLLIYLSECHNAVLTRQDELNKVAESADAE
jgi:hypothetical protein